MSTTVPPTTPKAVGDASVPHDGPIQQQCTTRFDLIRSEERAAAFQQFAEWISSYPDCPFGASARALLQKWAKREA